MNPVKLWLRDARSAPDVRHVDVCDGLRALAIFIVGWYHIWQQSWLGPNFTLFGRYVSLDPLVRSGYMWVDVLILISGFCLYLPWARLSREDAPPDALDFSARRLMRIHPSYLLDIAVMLCVALWLGSYRSSIHLRQDLLSHLTYTHTFFYNAYYATNLGGTLWTLAIEMQFYLLFPLLARAFRKAPGITFCAMTLAALAFRAWVELSFADISMLFNQLPAFLDVFALGMLAALVHVRMARFGRGAIARVACTVAALALIPLVWKVVRMQASCGGTEAIRQGQMDHRILIASLAAAFLVLSANAGLLLRKLLSNPLTRFFSAISMQFFIWHQTLAVWLLRLRVVPSAFENPNYDGDKLWQMRYTLLCFAVAIAVAALLTYGFEKPVARALQRRWNARRGASRASS